MDTKNAKELEQQLKGLTKNYLRRFRFKQLPYFALILLSVILVGVSEILKPDFTFETFKQARFWYNLFITNTANFVMALAALFITSDRIIAADKDDVIAKLTITINEIAPNIQDKMVDQFISETNHNIRKDVYKIKQHNKLLKLERRHSTLRNVKYFNDYHNSDDIDFKDNIVKKNKYVKKRLRLEMEIQEEWLDAHVDAIYIRNCPKLHRSFLTVGSNSSYTNDFPVSKTLVIIRGLMPKFLIFIAFTLIFFSFGLDYAKVGWISLFTLTFRLMCLVFNYSYGARFADTYVNETTIDTLYMRVRWLTRLRDWKLEKQKEKEMKEIIGY